MVFPLHAHERAVLIGVHLVEAEALKLRRRAKLAANAGTSLAHEEQSTQRADLHVLSPKSCKGRDITPALNCAYRLPSNNLAYLFRSLPPPPLDQRLSSNNLVYPPCSMPPPRSSMRQRSLGNGWLFLLCLILSCCCSFASADEVAGAEATCSSLVVILEAPTNTTNSYSIVGSHIALALQRRPDVDLYLLKLPNFMSSWKSHSGTALWGEEDGRVLDQEIQRVQAGDEVTGNADLTIRVTIDFRPPAFPSPMLVLATTERGYLSNEAISGDVTLREADWSTMKVVAPSRWAADGLLASGAKDVAVVPHGVSAKYFKPLDFSDRESLRTALGLVNKFVFLHVSAMTPNKNPSLLLSAFARVQERFGNTHLFLKGDDDMYSSESRLLRSPAGGIYARLKKQGSITYLGSQVRRRANGLRRMTTKRCDYHDVRWYVTQF